MTTKNLLVGLFALVVFVNGASAWAIDGNDDDDVLNRDLLSIFQESDKRTNDDDEELQEDLETIPGFTDCEDTLLGIKEELNEQGNNAFSECLASCMVDQATGFDPYNHPECLATGQGSAQTGQPTKRGKVRNFVKNNKKAIIKAVVAVVKIAAAILGK